MGVRVWFAIVTRYMQKKIHIILEIANLVLFLSMKSNLHQQFLDPNMYDSLLSLN